MRICTNELVGMHQTVVGYERRWGMSGASGWNLEAFFFFLYDCFCILMTSPMRITNFRLTRGI